MYPAYHSSGWYRCSILPRNYWNSWDNFHSVQKVVHLGTCQTGRRITLIACTEYVTILFGIGGRIGSDGCTFWDLHLLVDRLIWGPIGSLPFGRLLGRLGIKWELDQDILM